VVSWSVLIMAHILTERALRNMFFSEKILGMSYANCKLPLFKFICSLTYPLRHLDQ
jgi:hypothetical protein